MTDQHTDEMREAFDLFKETLTPADLRHYTAWQIAEMCHSAGVLHGLKVTARYQDALREASSVLTEIASDSGEAFMYSENLRINRAITTINKLLREANG